MINKEDLLEDDDVIIFSEDTIKTLREDAESSEEIDYSCPHKDQYNLIDFEDLDEDEEGFKRVTDLVGQDNIFYKILKERTKQ